MKRTAKQTTKSRPPVTLVCPECGASFTRYASQVQWRGARWCSMKCRVAGAAARKRACLWCHKQFVPHNPGTPGTGKFCSQRCWRAHEHARNPRSFTFTCGLCGRAFTRSAYSVRTSGKPKFCSRTCKDQARRRAGSVQGRGPGWRKIAESIRERDERRCVRCGKAEGNRRHSVDHIVPWLLVKHDDAVANHPDNLASLCARCHGIKTTVTEPRLHRGDWLALQEFYGDERAGRAMRTALIIAVTP